MLSINNNYLSHFPIKATQNEGFRYVLTYSSSSSLLSLSSSLSYCYHHHHHSIIITSIITAIIYRIYYHVIYQIFVHIISPVISSSSFTPYRRQSILSKLIFLGFSITWISVLITLEQKKTLVRKISYCTVIYPSYISYLSIIISICLSIHLSNHLSVLSHNRMDIILYHIYSRIFTYYLCWLRLFTGAVTKLPRLLTIKLYGNPLLGPTGEKMFLRLLALLTVYMWCIVAVDVIQKIMMMMIMKNKFMIIALLTEYIFDRLELLMIMIHKVIVMINLLLKCFNCRFLS